MTRALLRALTIAATTLMFTGSSLADIPPEPGYVESCTVANHTKEGVSCQSCHAWHGERDACQKTLAIKGYGKKCQTRGASTWNEVWCKPDTALGGPTPPPAKPDEDKPEADKSDETPTAAPKKKSSCSGGEAPVGWVALSLLGMLVFRRRCDANANVMSVGVE